MTGCSFSMVCLELSPGFDFNLRAPTQIARAFSVIREQGGGYPSGGALGHGRGCAPGPRALPPSFLVLAPWDLECSTRLLDAEVPSSKVCFLGRVISASRKDSPAGGHVHDDPGAPGSWQLATPHACS